MSHYRVMVEGTDIEVQAESGQIVRGFFTTRFVSALSVDLAIEKALAMVQRDLIADRASRSLESAKLSVSEVEPVGLFARLWGTNKGYTFYLGEPS